MANPLKMRQSGGVYSDGLQIMSTADMEYAAKLVLQKFTSETNGRVADIYIGGTGTSIGTFDDKFANGALSSHPNPDTTEYTTTTTFNQNTGTASEASMVFPCTVNTTSGVGLAPQTNTQLNDSIIDLCLDRIALANTTFAETGTYFLSNAAPSISGTWVSTGTVTDTVTNNAADSGQSVTYNLYRKSSDTLTATSPRPLKISTTNNSHIYEMTDAEIESLVARLRNRIIATGIGTYALQTTAPGTGTWVSRGSIVDRMPIITSQNYTGTYTGQYTRALVTQYTRVFTSTYTVNYVRTQFSRQFQRAYGAQYARVTPGPQYARATPGPQYNANFTRSTPGPAYSVSYTRIYSANYGRVYSAQYGRTYGGQYAITFTGSFTRVFSSAYSSQFARVYLGTYNSQFGRVFSAQYTRIATAQYQGDFTRGQFARTYAGQYGRSYSAQYDVGFSRQFTRTYVGQYGRTYSANYAVNYARTRPGPQYSSESFSRSRPGPQYARATPGPGYAVAYAAWYTGSYERGQFARTYLFQYAEAYFAQFTRIVGAFPNFYTAQYASTDPEATFTRNYLRATAGPQYTGYSAGPEYGQRPTPGYAQNYARVYVGEYTVNYARSRPGPQYTGSYSGQYLRAFFSRTWYYRTFSGQYGRVYSAAYFNQFTRVYAGNYATDYARSTPGPQYARATGGPQYTATYNIYYTRQITGPNYTRATGGPQYTGTYSSQFTRQTPGPNYARATTGPEYTGAFGRERPGPQYTGNYTRAVTGPTYNTAFVRASFTRVTPGPQYARATPGPAYARATSGPGYSVSFTRIFSANYAGSQFARVYSAQYARTYTAQYTSATPGPQYSGPQYAAAFSVSYTRQVPGPQYASGFSGQYTGTRDNTYSGVTITTNYNTITKTLWLRVA